MRCKRLAAAVIGMMMICSVPAYANESDAVAVYQEMEEKTRSMSDIDAYYDLKMDISKGKDHVGGRVEMNMKANQMNDPANLKFNAYMRLSLDLGSDTAGAEGSGTAAANDTNMVVTGNIYYADNMYYMDMLGSKLKMAAPLSEMMANMQSVQSLSHYSLDLMENMTLRTEGDIRIISFTLNQEKMDEMMNQVMAAAAMPALEESGASIRFRDISGEYEISPEGYYVKSREKITMDVTVEGETITIVLDGDVGIANPGQPVSFPAPNPAEYELVEQ